MLTLPVALAQVETNLSDFLLAGTQPDKSSGQDFDFILHSGSCRVCHEIYDPVEVPIYTRWRGSMMANSARDPLFHACLAIATQDAGDSGDLCLRCHTPGGWLGGRSFPTDGSALQEEDYDGVNCNFCHRMVDPDFKPGISPQRDEPILAALESAGLLPSSPGNGSYVVDPDDVRRGPFSDVPLNLHGVDIVVSPFHTKSEFCGTCHDVSNPALTRQPNGDYVLNTLGEPHPSQEKYDMFPLERTYSEWLNSTYATVGVDHGGVFGGNHPTGIMQSCQDCHMPDTEAFGCAFDFDPFFIRPNIPAHDFNGGNMWVQDMLANIYGWELNLDYLHDSKERTQYMLENACTLEVSQAACNLNVRIVNETGHKLPTGYPEGRRMWINVVFRDENLAIIAERGIYDEDNAHLTTPDTKVYEAKLGPDEAMAAATGLPAAPSFHFVLNNKWYKDNRIPPRGFTNAAFEAAQAAPVAATYVDGQYWDDTLFRIPPSATTADVTVLYQTASKEYISFLRDENVTNDAGDFLYAQWEETGKSPPVTMRQMTFTLNPALAAAFADADCDDDIDLDDYALVANCTSGPVARLSLGCEALDNENNGHTDLRDIAALCIAFTGGD